MTLKNKYMMATSTHNTLLRKEIEENWVNILKTYPEVFYLHKTQEEIDLIFNRTDNSTTNQYDRRVKFANNSIELSEENIVKEIETKTWDGRCIFSKLITKAIEDGITKKGCWKNGYKGFQKSLSNLEKNLLVDLSEFIVELINKILINYKKNGINSEIPLISNGGSDVKIGFNHYRWLKWFNLVIIPILK